MTMKNKNILVVIESNHPHYNLIKSKYLTRNADEAIASYDTYDLVVDLTIFRTEKKILFLKELARTTRAMIISDLTCTFQDRIFHQLPQVKASVSSFFYSPTNTIEFYIQATTEDHLKVMLRNFINEFFKALELDTFENNSIDITFTLPRVVSQIINEAFFALDEKLATKEDIDLAMINGVNYPLGPFKWAEKTGLIHVHSILEELFLTTHDMRYRASITLKKECL
jgi:3-hydroxybutyryl-CoA dehydrogenase